MESELKQFFAAYGLVKDCKIILDRAGVSKGYTHCSTHCTLIFHSSQYAYRFIIYQILTVYLQLSRLK